MAIQLEKQINKSGDENLASQGFGRVSIAPAPLFDPIRQPDAAVEYFETNGFVVLSPCLSDEEVLDLNQFFDRTQVEKAAEWGLGEKRKPHHRNQGLIFSQPLLDHPELDPYTQHPATYPIVSRLLGGEEQVRFSEFNLRETPENAGLGTMNFHHDATVEDRFIRRPYLPCDWLCAIHYLTDVNANTPAFCVVPKSNQFETLRESFDAYGEDYTELPIHGPAGSCVLYDTATFHTRLDGDGVQRRRTWHQYYGRGGWLRSALPTTDRYIRAPSPVLTDWNLFPERLAMHPDPRKRLFFSHWNTAQGEWAASGFDESVRAAMPRGKA
jgi:ectoine hydroxylase-related dioxygenase (phytanoyl-CoA dioxygenase family)